MKKISVLTIILLISFMCCACGKHSATVGSSNSIQQSTTPSMQDINNSMDKLDGALANSDNSKDINDTESIINNIN